MDQRTLQALEWDKLEGILIDFCKTHYGRSIIAERVFYDDPEDIAGLHRRTKEALELIATGQEPRIAQLGDVGGLIAHAGKGATLNHLELGVVLTLVRGLNELASSMRAKREIAPLLFELADKLHDHHEEESELIRALSFDETIINDSYSSLLDSLRKERSSLQRKIETNLEKILSRLADRDIVQDRFVTQRAGRYVLPVRIERKPEVKGIIHDYSSSGSTVFIEPEDILPFSNQLRIVEVKIEEEISRILAKLSAMIGEKAAILTEDLIVIGELDRSFAFARFSLKIDGCEPILSEQFRCSLFGLAHPLLLLRRDQIVRNDLVIADDKRGLVVSGPNAGGKTVLLKALGLIALMSKAGLNIPARDGSAIMLFDDVFIEIGDTQNIEDDLSTFSAHLLNLRTICQKATERSLAIIDEIASSTDPVEGGALGSAILTYLSRKGVTVLVATHLPAIKQLAISDNNFISAAMEFEHESLRPTYRLLVGKPGRSFAFEIAANLGLMKSILDMAVSMLDPDEAKTEQIVERLEQREQELSEKIAELTRQNEALIATRNHYVERLDLLEDRRMELRVQAHDNYKKELDRIKSKIAELTAEMQVHRENTGKINLLSKEIEQKAVEASGVALVRKREKPVFQQALTVGMQFRSVRFQGIGTVVEVPDQKGDFTGEFNGLKVRLTKTDLGEIIGKKKKALAKKPPNPGKRTQVEIVPVPPTTAMTCDVRGMDKDMAIAVLEKFLDEKMNRSEEYAYVIHGYGTGVLKKACRDFLSTSPYVRHFEGADPKCGGDGATFIVVDL